MLSIFGHQNLSGGNMTAPKGKRRTTAGLMFVVISIIVLVCWAAELPLTAQAGQNNAQEVPVFQVEPSWPKIPNGWIFGLVSSVSVDSQDHVWILQRPGTLSAEEKSKAAPPVLEFDAAGNFIQAWGGPGAGYEWPETEHGIYVDPK